MKIKYNGQITIEQCLAQMRGQQQPFWLAFVRASGKGRGSVKTVAKCLYGAPQARQKGQQRQRNMDGTERKKSLHVDSGTLPCTDYETGQYITPLISHIIGFNLKKVIHSNESS